MAEKSFRGRMADDADVLYEKVIKVITDALETVRKVWVDCPHCKKRSLIEIPDTKAAIAAAEFMTNNGFGRPSQADSSDDSEKIVFTRTVYMYEPDDSVKTPSL